MMSSTVGIKVRLKLRIIIRIALLSSYMFIDFESFWNYPGRSFIAKSKNPPNTTTNLKSAIWKSYTDGEHGDCKLLWMGAFFCTITLTIAYLMGDWGVLLWNLWLRLSHTMWLSLTSFWHQLCGTWNLWSLQYNTFPIQSCQRLQVTQIWFKLLLAGVVLLSRCPFECIFQASLLNVKITRTDRF